MKKKEIRKEFYDKWDNTKEFELGKSFNYYKDANKVWKWVEGKIDKAREEGKLEYILSLGWQDTDNEYVKEVLEDAERIAEKLSKLKE